MASSSTQSEGQPETDWDDEKLRVVLVDINKTVGSVEKLGKIAKLNGFEVRSRSALAKFIGGGGLHPENREVLKKFVSSPIARALRTSQGAFCPPQDRLIATLLSGNLRKPPNLDVAGLYFVYHGSYLYPEHFVIRLIEIACLYEVLQVTDYILDNQTDNRQLRTSNGHAVFFGGMLQIVTSGIDTRHGLSLFIGAETSPSTHEMQASRESEKKPLMRVLGKMIGMTTSNETFMRYCRFTRISHLTTQSVADARENAIKQTGIFKDNQLGNHREAFDQLARLVPLIDSKCVFSDPILALASKPKSGEPMA